MKLAVTGTSGRLARTVVATLRTRGHHVVNADLRATGEGPFFAVDLSLGVVVMHHVGEQEGVVPAGEIFRADVAHVHVDAVGVRRRTQHISCESGNLRKL